jgi:hypothetical protein
MPTVARKARIVRNTRKAIVSWESQESHSKLGKLGKPKAARKAVAIGKAVVS